VNIAKQMIKESQRDSIMSNPVQALTMLSGRSAGYADETNRNPEGVEY